jgi:catechol 2,3-dioxygenase
MNAKSATTAASSGEAVGMAPPGFRLPPDLRLGAVRLQVADLARSQAYYEEVLGFRVADRDSRDAVLTAVDDDVPLVHLHEHRAAASALHQPRLGLYHFAILLPDRSALGRFVAHLSEIGARAGASDHLVSEALYLRDPDRLGIEVYADRPRGSWQVANREIRMDTTALDLVSVVRAAGGERWKGMPAGTRIGHVHLHVADLDAAAAFYHAALGLDKVVWSYPNALFLSAGGYHHHLGLNTWAGPDAPPARLDEARLMEWRIELPDVAAVAAAGVSLEAAGYPVSREPDGWRAADPWGTELRVVRANDR